ncbi:IclR family transcriptional regulator [Nonomuraea jiangxiensis]|uniref:Glycerol operon regulatory protein n=1 Tax=Nonomuraea jiangxiensis TaxID=633440 RepID=A0A1G7YDP8_9ACTN|nr:IclR family transcriptional regulator [Nonomuraea jiangxiensis]SDG94435.1 DNA-binding transcriptional regulator, IclR family [Nonomuraea jiangxiensis]
MSNTTTVQSVDRAIAILEILARDGATRVTDLAVELDVHKSTAFRLLAALEQGGLVEQSGERGRYRLGFGVVRLAGAATAQLDLSRESRPVCLRLAETVGETVNIAVPRDGDAVNISQVRGPAAISGHNWVGQRTPSHATSSGKVLLAFGALRLPAELRRYTPHTVTSAAGLALDEVRERGWAATVEELEVGLNAVAAPIRGSDGSVVAAVSASGPSYRLTPPRLPEVGALLVAAAREISQRIGYYG